MPLTVFDCKGISATQERIGSAVETAGKSLSELYEAWISADSSRGGVRVLITGRYGFERTVRFTIDEDPAVIREQVREMIEAESLQPWRDVARVEDRLTDRPSFRPLIVEIEGLFGPEPVSVHDRLDGGQWPPSRSTLH
jgi:hypothetical protein